IHAATLRVLEGTGIRVLEKEAVSLLQSVGASFDDDTETVRIPEDVLMDCISSTPVRFKLYSRDEARSLRFGEGEVHLSSIGTAVQVEGLDGTVRPSTLKDLESFLRLTDALPNIDHSSLVCWPRDVPDDMAHMYSIYTGFKNTNKTIDGQNWGTREAEESIGLAAIAAGGLEELAEKPLLLGFSSPVSPLTLSKEGTEGLISYARAGQPCVYPPECMAGGTSPVTLAGLLVQQNAEVLASVAVAQLARRGAPSVYSSVSGTMDMRTGTIALGAPEVGLIMAGTAQLARFYKMPCRGTGGNTDAMGCDYQAGAETAATMLMAAMAGIDFVYDAAGSIESSLTASYTKLVLDDSVCGEVKRVLSGSIVSDDTLATEVIDAVHSKGTYLGHPHTLKHFRHEAYIPPAFWRGSRRAWDAQGRSDLREKAARKAENILNDHDIAVPLDPDVELKMKEYIKEVSRRHGV
ncbi:MAG TPA: trimethylamine methyltransferase family protein, partial [Thermoplasmata archaeon]|nr:trimethylamine methyltransferase family protein [Thermoplasmata archaeon]